MRGRRWWERCLARAGPLPSDAAHDLEAALRCVDPAFPRFVAELAKDFGVEGEDCAWRVDALLFEFAAIQVADDLADGDCDYLPDPERSGPGTHWLLQHLFWLCLLSSRVSRADAEGAARDFLVVGAAQQREVRVRRWHGALAEEAARNLNGKQHAAYFRLLASGTPHSERAPMLGEAFGFALHVVTDVAHCDDRWTSLDAEAKQGLVRRASAVLASLHDARLSSLAEPISWFEGILRGVACSGAPHAQEHLRCGVVDSALHIRSRGGAASRISHDGRTGRSRHTPIAIALTEGPRAAKKALR
jgi:hypothetical protein